MDEDDKAIDTQLNSAVMHLEKDFLKLLNPLNAEEERRKFFSGGGRILPNEPQFEYATTPDFSAENDTLKELQKKVLGSRYKKLFLERINPEITKIGLLSRVGTKKFTNASKRLNGKPSKQILRKAMEMVSDKKNTDNYFQESKERRLTANAAAALLEKKLAPLKSKFTIALDGEMSSKAGVNIAECTVKLNLHRSFFQSEIERLYVHEVETHVFRHLNGEKQPLACLSFGCSRGYNSTEEGLAIFNEEKSGVIGGRQQVVYASRALAVDYALKHTFFETYEYLCGFLKKEDAYGVAQRVKRGVANGERGAFTKDHLYLTGEVEVKRLYEKKGNELLRLLYYGKISLKETGFVKKISGVREPKLFPKWMEK